MFINFLCSTNLHKRHFCPLVRQFFFLKDMNSACLSPRANIDKSKRHCSHVALPIRTRISMWLKRNPWLFSRQWIQYNKLSFCVDGRRLPKSSCLSNLANFVWLLTGNLKTRISNGQQRMLVMVYSLFFFRGSVEENLCLYRKSK